MNLRIDEAMKQDFLKILNTKIIYPIKHYTWVANWISLRKKNGEIRLYVDFKNVNQVSLKDDYPLPFTDYILKTIVGACYFSMIDGFLGFNQLWVKDKDQHKIAFTTNLGTFAFHIMPFGLSNVRAIF